MTRVPDLERWPTDRLLSTAARLVKHAWDEELTKLGLTPAGVSALDALAANGPMTQARLAGIVQVQAQTMSRTLKRLESHGHVRRQASRSDRRSHTVSVTKTGLKALADALEIERAVLATPNLDIDRLRRELEAILQELTPRP